MHKRLLLTLFAVLFIALSIQSDAFLRRTTAKAKVIPAPEDVLGFHPGDDRKLASWAKVIEYFQKLAASSDRVKFEEIGKSTMGAPLSMPRLARRKISPALMNTKRFSANLL